MTQHKPSPLVASKQSDASLRTPISRHRCMSVVVPAVLLSSSWARSATWRMLVTVGRSCQLTKERNSSSCPETIDQTKTTKFSGLSRMAEAFTRHSRSSMCKCREKTNHSSSTSLGRTESSQAAFPSHAHSETLKPKMSSTVAKME